MQLFRKGGGGVACKVANRQWQKFQWPEIHLKHLIQHDAKTFPSSFLTFDGWQQLKHCKSSGEDQSSEMQSICTMHKKQGMEENEANAHGPASQASASHLQQRPNVKEGKAFPLNEPTLLITVH